MGTASTTKILQLNSENYQAETPALKTTAGVADAGRIPALNDAGILDPSMINAKSGNSGAGDAGSVVARGADGRIAMADMPTGIGADTMSIQASEALASGDYVNLHEASGAFRVRKADATTAGKEAHGFVLASVASGAQATVYFEGTNTQVTAQSPGRVFLQTTPGKGGPVAPTGSGNAVQCIGLGAAATAVNFQYNLPVIRG